MAEITVRGGSFCGPAGTAGTSSAGTPMVCSPKNPGERARWRRDPSAPEPPRRRRVRAAGPAHGKTNQEGTKALDRDQAQPQQAPVSGAMSDKPLTVNRWGEFADSSYPISFHQDGEIGRAIRSMGADARMDFDGEPLADVLGRAATDAVVGRGTSQQTLDRLKAVRDRLPAGSRARRALGMAVDELDAPITPTPSLPDGTPAPLRQLMADLHAVPLVRREPDRERDVVARIAADVAAGKIGGRQVIKDVQLLWNRRHESTEGKAEIDRAVNLAVNGLEAIRRSAPRA